LSELTIEQFDSEKMIAGTVRVFESRAWNIGIIEDVATLPEPVPADPLRMEVHRAGSYVARQETGKSGPVAMLRRGDDLVAYFTIEEIEHIASLLRNA
jgi:hypothetical protein